MSKIKKTWNLEKSVEKICKDYSRVLIGLAHYDIGKKQKDCNCCYCNPKKK